MNLPEEALQEFHTLLQKRGISVTSEDEKGHATRLLQLVAWAYEEDLQKNH